VIRNRWDVLAVIAAGGAVGSVARWSLTLALPHTGGEFPWATWWANVTGAFALGVLMVFVLDVWPPRRYVRPFLGVGVLGGYTTYSTMMNDTRSLAAAGSPGTAAGYLALSVGAGLAAIWLGIVLARLLVAAGEVRRRRNRDLDAEPDVRSRQ